MKTALFTVLVLAVFIGSSVYVYGAGINSGNPVPYIQADEASAEFLAERVAKDSGGDEEDYLWFARSLAKTLSQFTAAEQNEFWYGP